MQPNQHIADLGPLLSGLGIRHVIIAPGSRNAPLIQLFTYNKTFLCYSIVDERSAGYVALGMALTLRQPVAIVTTSGTAVLNLSPAVAEAFYQHVPMVVLTADRPVEAVRQFNNQVIDQTAPFYNYTKGFYEMPFEPRNEQDILQALTSVEKLVKEGTCYPAGPVHINVPLLEPLYEPLPEADQIFQSGSSDPADLQEPPDSSDWGGSHQKILLLGGAGRYDENTSETLLQLAKNQRVVTIAENISNLPSKKFVHHPELILSGAAPEELEQLKPDLVIGLGGQVVSKRLKNFLQSDPAIRLLVPDQEPSIVIRGLLHHLDRQPKGLSNGYVDIWKTLEEKVMAKAIRAMDTIPFCNLSVIREILQAAPAGAILHLGNSTTIRYSQLIPFRDDITYYSNRGTSGIDGSVSTAVGSALAKEGLHLLVVGDLSFVYDSNALWNQRFPGNLRIIVLNDGGGSIFRLLDGPDRMNFFEEFSVTHHPVSLEMLAQAFGRRFRRVSGTEELKEVLGVLMQPDSPVSVLEIDTTASENSRIFESFFEKIR
jgi:2-succinyl-5-enolpyruvyl-6-hydroxy-3-cyclohexene-1-carboxylate synthase